MSPSKKDGFLDLVLCAWGNAAEVPAQKTTGTHPIRKVWLRQNGMLLFMAWLSCGLSFHTSKMRKGRICSQLKSSPTTQNTIQKRGLIALQLGFITVTILASSLYSLFLSCILQPGLSPPKFSESLSCSTDQQPSKHVPSNLTSHFTYSQCPSFPTLCHLFHYNTATVPSI